MAGNIQSDIINAEFRASGAKATQDEVLKVSQSIKELASEEKNLLFIKNKLESQGKKNTEEWKKNEAAIKSNREATRLQKDELGKLNSALKITEMTYNQLSKRAVELRSKLNNISQAADPAKWNKYNKELTDVQSQMQKVRAGSQQTSSVFSSLSKAAGILGVSIGGAFSIVKLGKTAIDSTNLSADAFEKTIGGLKGMVDKFFISLASGDWSNFWEGLKKSKESAEALVETLDVLGDLRRGYSIEEAKLENETNAKLLILRDKTGKYTIDQKKKVYAELVEMTEGYNAKILDAAYRERDAILDNYSAITGLDKSEIFEIISKYSDYEQKFSAAAEKLEAARKAGFAETKIGDTSKKAFDMDKYIAGLSNADRLFTQLYLNYGKLNDTNLDKLKDSIIGVEKALGANTKTELENIRVYNEVFKQKEENNEKEVEALRQVSNEKSTILQDDIEESQKYAEKQLEESLKKSIEYGEREIEANERKLEQELKDFVESEEFKKKYQEEYDKFMVDYKDRSANEILADELKRLDKRRNELLRNDKLTAEQRLEIDKAYEDAKAKLQKDAQEKQLDDFLDTVAGMEAIYNTLYNAVTTLRDNEIKEIEDGYDKKIKLAGDDKTKVTKLEEEKERKIKATRKKYADQAFALQIGQIIASTAQTAIEAYKALAGIPYVGPALGAAAAAAAIVYGGIQVSSAQRERQKAKGLFTGGYSGDGDKYEVAGVLPSGELYHRKEYVVASEELSNPAIGSFIHDFVEPIRMRRIGQGSHSASTGFAGGGFSSSSSGNIDLVGSIEKQNRLLEANIRLMSELKTKGVNANFDENKIYELRSRVSKQESMDARARK